MCVFTVVSPSKSCAAISAFDPPLAMSRSTSSVRSVSTARRPGLPEPGGGRRTYCSTNRRRMTGAEVVGVLGRMTDVVIEVRPERLIVSPQRWE